MFKASKLLLGLAALLALAACGDMEEAPAEHLDLGIYVISDYKMPATDHSAMQYAQRMMGKTVTLGPDRILFPQDFGQTDCQHAGYRLTQRPTSFIPSFELGSAGPLSAADAEITDTQLVEVWNGCVNGAYLSLDHSQLYLPGQGALFVLRKL